MARFSQKLRGEERWLHALGERVADKITAGAGTMLSVLLHAAWFFLWFLAGGNVNTLTLVVSLEAIFLSLFIMVSQKRAAARDQAALERDKAAQRAALEALLANSRALLEITEAVRHGMAEQDEILEDLHEALEPDDGTLEP